MPRRERPPLEERLKQAKELFEFKQRKYQKEITKLYNTPIYKLAKRTTIIFLWIVQLLAIDWLLPYKSEGDKITSGFQIVLQKSGLRPIKEMYLNVVTQSKYTLQLALPTDDLLPHVGDSILIQKSLLFKDIKKVNDLNNKLSYPVSSSITYKFFSIIIICFGLSLAFLFIKNIEVKAFYYFMFILNGSVTTALIYYFVTACQ